MNNKNCEYEDNTIKYFVSQLAQNELASAENHIANCPYCCQTIAELTRAMFSQQTQEEKAFLDSYAIKSQEEIKKLIKQSLEPKENTTNINTNTTNNMATFPAKTTDNKKSLLSYWKTPYVSLATSLAFIVLFGATIFVVLQNNASNTEAQITKSIAVLKEVNSEGRPIKFRLEGFDYASETRSRGQALAETQSKLEEIQVALKTKISHNPTAKNLDLLAQTFVMSGKYNEAIQSFNKAVLLSPNDPALFTNLAVAYAANSNYQNALTAVNKALAINESYLPAIFNRALIYEEVNQYDNANSEWQKYLRLDTSSSWATEAQEHLPHEVKCYKDIE